MRSATVYSWSGLRSRHPTLSALRKAETLTALDGRLAQIDTEISSAEAGMGALSCSPERMAEKLAKASVRESVLAEGRWRRVRVAAVGAPTHAPASSERLKVQYLDAGRTAGGVPAEQWPETVEVARDTTEFTMTPLQERGPSEPYEPGPRTKYAKPHKALRAS